MLSITRNGSARDLARAARDIPARVIPLAASTALTRTAQHAQRTIVSRLPQVFDRPTPYTLNSTFIVPSTVKTMSARVAVKDAAGHETPLVLGEDYMVRGEPTNGQTQMNAPLVFVGYGVVAPEHKRDDYKGVDVRGKIAVMLIGAPKSFQTEERAYHGDMRVKRAAALAHGAVGVLTVNTPTREKLVKSLDSMQKVDLGGFRIDFSSSKHTGSEFVDIGVIGKDCKLLF